MREYLENKELKPGYYFNPNTGEFIHIGQDGPLPLRPQEKLVKLPLGGLLVLAPIMSLVYIIFLPFAGIASALIYLGIKVRWMAWLLRHAHEETASR